MKRIGISWLALAVAIGWLAGCSGRGAPDEALTAALAGERIQQAVDLSEMKPGNAEKLRKLYDVEAQDIADFILFTAKSNVRADELTVIQVKEASDTEAVIAKLKRRVEAQTIKFKDYRPEAYDLIQKYVLKTRGPFVLFAVSKDADRIERAFDEAMEG